MYVATLMLSQKPVLTRVFLLYSNLQDMSQPRVLGKI